MTLSGIVEKLSRTRGVSDVQMLALLGTDMPSLYIRN
jgi:hypothetical protein